MANEKEKLEQLDEKYTKLLEEYRELEEKYNALLHSKSWRVTAPLRFVVGTVKTTSLGKKAVKLVRYYRTFGMKATLLRIGQTFKRKLLRLFKGVGEDDYCNNPVFSLKEMVRFFAMNGALVNGKKTILQMKKNNRILLVTHELNLTGAPVAVENMAKSFRQLGKDVVVLSPRDGNLRKRLVDAGIPVIVFNRTYSSNLVKRCSSLFDLIVVSTTVGAPLIQQLSGMPIPVMWWIHEARASYTEENLEPMPNQLSNNIHIYCGGAYAQALLKGYRPNYVSKQFLYCTPDLAAADSPKGKLDLAAAEGKTVFALVGMLEERKGQDVLAEAIRKLPAEKLENCYFVIVGRQCYPPQYRAVMNLCADFPNNVCYIEELKREDLACLYDRMDCLLCVSRDDPMPIVVTDALSLSKCVICSENTGSAALLQEMSSGLIYHNNSPDELAACIESFLEDPQALTAMRARARETYTKYFTEEIFRSNLTAIVSGIAPTLRLFADIPLLYLPAENGASRWVYRQDKLAEYDQNIQKNILLLSDGLTETKGEAALHKMADALRAQGHNIVILSEKDGAMREKYTADGFPVVVFEDVNNTAANSFLEIYSSKFDWVVANSVIHEEVIKAFYKLLKPVLWWVHDDAVTLPADISSNVKILCESASAKEAILSQYCGEENTNANNNTLFCEKELSEENFVQDLQALVEAEWSQKRKNAMAAVSVVIPSYNAGEPFREMLQRLNGQKGITKVEVVVVDSGSTDGTQQIVKECGARLIQITQEEFSHSYARNLGAQNATGHILLFMTQDAMPADEYWVKQMVAPILKGECSATSCREECPPDTDLYYRVSAWCHARFLGIGKASKIGTATIGMDAEEFRKCASLNDVSTAIDKSLFDQMGYRHSFAEDLDMGMRILQARKNTKLLHSPAVIHGHNRGASYCLRRGFAEGRALERIMDIPGEDFTAKDLAKMIITGYGVMQRVLAKMRSEAAIQTVSEFDKRLKQLIRAEKNNPYKVVYGQSGADAYVEGYVQKLEPLLETEKDLDFTLVDMMAYYWADALSVCLTKIDWEIYDLPVQICDCLYKQMAMMMGNRLSHMESKEPCYKEFRKMIVGV